LQQAAAEVVVADSNDDLQLLEGEEEVQEAQLKAQQRRAAVSSRKLESQGLCRLCITHVHHAPAGHGHLLAAQQQPALQAEAQQHLEEPEVIELLDC
jgi:hypothetical protein